MRWSRVATLVVAASAAVAVRPVAAQTFPTNDATLKRIWDEGMSRSQLEALGQTLTDSIGPRLTGSPGLKSGNDWLVQTYTKWGVPARNEKYGTWNGWRRGVTHVDLVAPRVRTLEGTMLAWSPGTKGPVEGPAIALPDVQNKAQFDAWLPSVKGKYVLVSMPQPTCRTDDNWEEFGLPESVQKMKAARTEAQQAWAARVRNTGLGTGDTPQQQTASATRLLPAALERAGALGVITSLWSQGWGVNKIFNARTTSVPTLDLSCEDYGLVFRLAERNQGPRLRVNAQAQALGEVPVFNTIAEIKGSEKPDEYVVLSAHFDSWDGSSGATDNATGTITMLEAVRILKQVYPNPKRTIVVGHWGGEEQGLNGSRAFAADHPEIVSGMQALFNQDNGTGRVVNISMQGLTGAAGPFANWIAQLPPEITRHINLDIPGTPGGGGSDYASFVCHGAPAFSLSSLGWSYGTYTWHTNRDTYDKIVFDDVRSNAVLTAMLTYLASEDPQKLPRDRRVMTADSNGRGGEWPSCQAPAPPTTAPAAP